MVFAHEVNTSFSQRKNSFLGITGSMRSLKSLRVHKFGNWHRESLKIFAFVARVYIPARV